MLVSILASFLMRRVVFNINMTETKRVIHIMVVPLLLMMFCYEAVEMAKWQVTIYVLSFTMLTAMYDSAYACGLNRYVKGYVLEFGYLSHIGILSGLIAWSTRWTF
ncbi:hypothetical protein MPK71_gp202 [Erwinia phage pEa_SNUABM_1]|uniref:Uncharacterized protein n=1 Tax=Erwinia phage pEa_SNUABM_1 TaxID=2869543 RepID=A0AAE7XJF7_9CAUD|nr:hypothetical protein MPK71_gp202 [Erwinia phage pEa_SNUABM_1]QZE57411.1 hypothetical protein pEaSNUABM1_00202 [Erwinia phage pEa_SNUABM_1]